MIGKRTLVYLVAGLLVLAAAAALVVGRSSPAGKITVSTLARETHFHGIAVYAHDTDRLFLATHHGLFAVAPDGSARRISQTRDDFMGFTPHPANSDVLYASGHPAGGGNLGFIVSRDGGETWARLADGVDGPVDFHQMDVSKANPEVVYGVFRGLQRSTDGGRTWTRVGPVPDGIIDLAASSRGVDRLYAATRDGLLVSTDGGRQWRPAQESRQPVTMVDVTPDGRIHAFIVGRGLMRAEEAGLDWTDLGDGPGGGVVLHLAVATDGDRRTLYAVVHDPETRTQSLHVSRDGGRAWSRLGAGEAD